MSIFSSTVNAVLGNGTSIPSIAELADRFTNLNKFIKVEIRTTAHIPEVGERGPFYGIVSVKKLINVLNRDVDVIFEDDDHLKKIRNTIIYYNEYICGSKTLNPDGEFTAAIVAQYRVEDDYNFRFKLKLKRDENKNPYTCKLLDDRYENESPDDDSGIELAMQRRLKELRGKSSSKTTDEKIKTMHSTLCESFPNRVSFDNLEFCWENVEFFD